MLEHIQVITLDSSQVSMLDQQPTLEHMREHILDSSLEIMQELQHIQVTTLDSSQVTTLGSMQELQHILAIILDPSQATTLVPMQALETMQEIMPATLAEHTQPTSLVQQ